MSPRISRRTALIGAAVALALVVIVILVLVLTGGDDNTPNPGKPTATATTPSYDPSATPTPVPTQSGGPSATPTPSTSTARPATPRPTSTTRPKPQTKPLGDSASLGGGSTAVVATVKAVDGKAELPGEVGGPAISVDITVTAGSAPISFDQTVVNAYYGADDTPAVALTTGTKPLSGTIPAGGSATGTYVFSVPTNQLGRVAVELDLSLTVPVTVFRGAVR